MVPADLQVVCQLQGVTMQVANCQNQNQTLEEVRLETASFLLQTQISRVQRGCDAKWMDAATAGVSAAAAGSRYFVSKLTNPTTKLIFVKFR